MHLCLEEGVCVCVCGMHMGAQSSRGLLGTGQVPVYATGS